MSKQFNTREEWLNAFSRSMRPTFKHAGAPIPPNVRLSCSFTSNGSRGKAIGECWSTNCSKDQTFEIFISPIMDLVLEEGKQGVADILAHELVHAAVGLEHGHKGEFKRVSGEIGLAGKLTATVAGNEFCKIAGPIVDNLGPYPHAELMAKEWDADPIGGTPGTPKDAPTTSRPKKQNTRLLKVECGYCGYVARVAKKWILEVGAPLCPCNGQPMEHPPI